MRLRSANPKAHRYIGYVSLALSLLLAGTGIYFVFSKLAYSHDDIWHIHKLRIGKDALSATTVLAWPTFSAALFPLFTAQVITTIKAFVTARARNFQEHRRWATLLTLVGFIVPMQRFAMVISYLIGVILLFTPQHVIDLLQVPDTSDMEAMVNAEKAAFALTTWAAIVSILIYTLTNSNKVYERKTYQMSKGKSKNFL